MATVATGSSIAAANPPDSRLEDGGRVTLQVGLHRSTEAAAKLRGYVWSHWNSRIGGKIVADDTTKEGRSVAIEYLVKPNDAGVWCVFVTIQRFGELDLKRRFSKYASCLLRRVKNLGSGKLAAIPEGSALPPDQYLVELRDAEAGAMLDGL